MARDLPKVRSPTPYLSASKQAGGCDGRDKDDGAAAVTGNIPVPVFETVEHDFHPVAPLVTAAVEAIAPFGVDSVTVAIIAPAPAMVQAQATSQEAPR